MSDTAASTPRIPAASESVAPPPAPKKPAAKKSAKAAKPVWVVRKGSGLEQLGAEKAKTAIAAGKVRTATDRDLEIAGIDPSLR